MQKLEILSPVGGEDCLYPAVRSGADAVYLGASRLSARANAKNFDEDSLRRAVEYCHGRGVRVYLACNTLVRDEELGSAMELIEYVCSIPVDGLIMQDLGLISLVRRACPDMRLHASTQMSVSTLKGVEQLAELGFKRVVLSRELSRNEIEYIARNSPIELEVFVHGALCMSVSGQCYFSAMLGSRSGNRGACAQPCRLPFAIDSRDGYALSLKDCSLISYLRELQDMGVASAKIEGRMKRPEYVAAATAACRMSLDTGKVDEELYHKLSAVFSRSGFTDGYYTGKRGTGMFGIRSKEDVLSASGKVLASIHEGYRDELSRIPVNAYLTADRNLPIKLTVSDKENHSYTSTGDVPQSAKKVPTDRERCYEAIKKTGGTPFYIESFGCDIDNGLFLPAPVLNNIRREALSGLLSERTKRDPVEFSHIEITNTPKKQKTRKRLLRARFTDNCIPDEFLECELIYVPMTLGDKELTELMDRGFAVAVEIPRGIFSQEEEIIRRLKEIQRLGINEVLASNIGSVYLARQLDMDIHGGFGLNITNTRSLMQLRELGVMDAELSFELTLDQISAIGEAIPTGIITYGRLPLMLMRNCPGSADGTGFDFTKEKHSLIDRKNIEFPLQTTGECTELLNSLPLTLSDRRKEITGVDFEVMRFSLETENEKKEALRLYNKALAPEGKYTRGLYYRGVY